MSVSVIRKIEARNFMEGSEHCREYVVTEKMKMGSSAIPPGQTGATDIGHSDSEEIFFVVKGHVLLFDNKEYHELLEGDIAIVAQGTPHTLINIGEETALVTWTMAPPEENNLKEKNHA